MAVLAHVATPHVEARMPDRAVEVWPERSGRDPVLDSLQRRRRGRSPRGPHRLDALCALLGRPQDLLDAVHVVGTDGKTSVTRMLASLLATTGARVGDTTSPHLESVEERVRIHGTPVDRRLLEAVTDRMAGPIATVDRVLGERVTFFEAITAAAFMLFADEPVDHAVVEAGIGGVGDPTSVLGARTVVLTTVGRDHPQLGSTLTDVAREKAGVVAPGGTLICAPQPDEVAAAVGEIARQRDAQVIRVGEHVRVVSRRPTPGGQVVDLACLDGLRVRGELSMHGAHQATNAALALAAAQVHLGRPLDPRDVAGWLARVSVAGRVEVVRRVGRPVMVLDGAHDTTASWALTRALSEIAGSQTRSLVVGVGGGRDPREIVRPLLGAHTRVVATSSGTRDAMPAARVARRLRAVCDQVRVVDDPQGALAVAEAEATPEGVVVVTGSLHLVGAVRGLAAELAREPRLAPV